MGRKGRFIIGALSVISSCTMGLEISMEKWLNSNHIKPEPLFSVLLSLYRMLQYVYENLMCCNFNINSKASLNHR